MYRIDKKWYNTHCLSENVSSSTQDTEENGKMIIGINITIIYARYNSE